MVMPSRIMLAVMFVSDSFGSSDLRIAGSSVFRSLAFDRWPGLSFGLGGAHQEVRLPLPTVLDRTLRSTSHASAWLSEEAKELEIQALESSSKKAALPSGGWMAARTLMEDLHVVLDQSTSKCSYLICARLPKTIYPLSRAPSSARCPLPTWSDLNYLIYCIRDQTFYVSS